MIMAMTQDEMFQIAALFFVAYLGIRAVYRRLTLSREERGFLSLAGSQGMDRSQAQQWRKQRRHMMQQGSGLMKVQMKFCLLTLTILMTLGMTARAALAQQVLPSIKLHGVPVSCTADGGKRVPLIISDKAIKKGGGLARVDSVNGPTLMLSPTYLNTWPRLAAFNLFYHECAHLALPIGKGLQENKEQQERTADCYAIKKMREHGLISSMEEFKEATSFLRKQKATSEGHLPGPERVRLAAKCAKIPVVARMGDGGFCRDLDMVFAGGNAFLKRYDFDNKKLFGLYCSYDVYGSEAQVTCLRTIERKKSRTSFANTLASKVRNCLPSDFKYEYSVTMPEFSHSWESDATGHGVTVVSDYADSASLTVTFPK